jgi:hypothetical protein
MKVECVSFGGVKEGLLLSFNPFYVSKISEEAYRRFYAGRLDCLMYVESISEKKKTVSERHANLVCVNPTERRWHRAHSPFQLRHFDLSIIFGDIGNLLLQVYNDICHKCGRYSGNCWSFSGHKICSKCRKTPNTLVPPYRFGVSGRACCNHYGCGKRVLPFRSEGSKVLDRAVRLHKLKERSRGRGGTDES